MDPAARRDVVWHDPRSMRATEDVLMMRTTGLRSKLGRSTTTMMYLAAAGAMYAWRTSHRRQRDSARDGSLGTAAGGADTAQDDREIEPANRWRDDPAGHGAIGITDLPPDVEAEQQAALPERGTRKPGVHA
jgi:hypothetical protein